jgi:hypothetical protein
MRGVSTIPRQAAREHCSSPGRGRGAAARRVAVDLSTQDIERIAAQVVQLLGEREAQSEPELLSAGELARRLRVERPWVYRYREVLGGIRMGRGPKAPWRFDYAAAVEALCQLQADPGQRERGR